MKPTEQCLQCLQWHAGMCGAYKEHPGGDCLGYIHKDDKGKMYELAAAMREYARRKRGL
jgi:hypothetical protein